MKTESLQDYESRVRSVPGATEIDFEALKTSYLVRYSKERKPVKYYDADKGKGTANIVFDYLKSNVNKGLHNAKIRKELSKGIKDKRLTKIFYFPSKMFDILNGFDSNFVSTKVWMKEFKQAERLMLDSMNVVKLQPRLIEEDEDIRTVIKKVSSSAGFSSYSESKEERRDWMIRNSLRIKRELKEGKEFDDVYVCPAIALTRSQLGVLGEEYKYVPPIDHKGNFKWKTRLIWALSAEHVRFEAQYARPLIDHLSDSWINCATGKTDLQIQHLLDCFGGTDWMSIDFAAFDSTVQSWLIKRAFEIIKMFFDEKYHRELDFICYKYINTEILMPDGNIYTKRKGIPSGSYFTQLVGSMCNMLMILTFLSWKFGETENDRGLMSVVNSHLHSKAIGLIAMGDDDIFAWNSTFFEIEEEEMNKFMECTFGVTISIDKKSRGKIGVRKNFLKRWWTSAGRYRDPVDLLLTLMHPERKRTYNNYSAWHVLYGYLLTYRRTFDELGMTEDFVIRGMHENGGVALLLDVPTEELPGTLGQLKRSNYHAWEMIVTSAIAREGALCS